jgi:hypothetical protein
MEGWRVGFKCGNRSDFYSFTFGYARSKHGLYLSIISTIINPLLHYSITPVLQVRLTTCIDNKRMTAVYKRR